MIHIKRIYDQITPDDGYRVLVDRLWPRGVKRETAAIDLWAKAIAPSTELRRWYHHQPEASSEFRVRYRLELSGADAVAQLEVLRAASTAGPVTLLTAARNATQSHALVLRLLLTKRE